MTSITSNWSNAYKTKLETSLFGYCIAIGSQQWIFGQVFAVPAPAVIMKF